MNNNISLREKVELFAANDRFHMLLLLLLLSSHYYLFLRFYEFVHEKLSRNCINVM